ncbi:PilW family protein [Colwellia sp. MEBiC06753]
MKNVRGISIIELLISLAVGLALFAGVMSVFVGMRTTTEETSSYGELQENGRFALSLLTDDLLRQDFWGDYPGTLDRSNLSAVPGAPAIECIGDGVNNGSFPLAVGQFRTLWGKTVDTANLMGCIDDAKVDGFTDVIQIKRVAADPVIAIDANRYHLNINTSNGVIFSGAVIPNVDNARLWEYQHHVYYVRNEAVGTNVVPVLMKGQLTTAGMSIQPAVDGIDVIRFMYGLDLDNDGIVNTYVSADNLTRANWNNAQGSNILAVKVFVVARNITPDNDYTDNRTYQVGDLAYTPNDNYRRLMFSSTVSLVNKL